jgi:hypothetical protein
MTSLLGRMYERPLCRSGADVNHAAIAASVVT